MQGRTFRAVVFGIVLAVVTLSPALASAAQADDPYGPTSTTPPSSFAPECDLSVTSVAPGARVTATVSNVPPGATVRILIDGEEVGRGTAPPAPSTIRRTVAFQAAATVDIDFVVPDLAPGRHLVSAVGANFTIECEPAADGFEVLDAAIGNGPGSEGNGGRLAFTGFNIFLLVVLGLGLLLAGRYVARLARERREARTY